MGIPSASTDLHAYKRWRKSLRILEPDTILVWMGPNPYNPYSPKDRISKGMHFIVEPDREPLFSKWDKTPAGRVVPITQCTKTGKRYKRQFLFTMEALAKFLASGEFALLCQ